MRSLSVIEDWQRSASWLTTRAKDPDVMAGWIGAVTFASIVLPLLPIWSFAIRVLAGAIVSAMVLRSGVRGGGWLLATVFVIPTLVLVGQLAISMLNSPVGFAFGSVLSVYGMQMDWRYAVLLLILDFALVLGLLATFRVNVVSQVSLTRVSVALLLCFWLAPHLPPAHLAIAQWERQSLRVEIEALQQQSHADRSALVRAREALQLARGGDSVASAQQQLDERVRNLQLQLKKTNSLLRDAQDREGRLDDGLSVIEKQLAGLATWSTWVIAFLATLVVCRSIVDASQVLRAVASAGVVVGFIVTAQLVLGDFSYILESEELSGYFYRARGTYYYHAAVSLILCFSLFPMLSGEALGVSKRRTRIGLGVVVSAAYFNGTRAVSLGIIAGCAIYLAFTWALGPRRKRFLIFAIALLFATSVFYEKSDGGTARVSTKASTVAGLVGTNLPRLELLKLGLQSVLQSPWTGQGVGTAHIPLSGRYFGGELDTVSSHAFFLDVALMGGILAGIAVLALFLLILIGGASSALQKRIPRTDIEAVAALSATLGAFLLTSVFFPQERNYTIMVAFVVGALGLGEFAAANGRRP